MEDCIRKMVYQEEKKKSRNKEASLEIHILTKDRNAEEFILNTVKAMDSSVGTFRCVNSSSLKDQNNGYSLYLCSRSGTPKPQSYKAQGCKAYVSFKIKKEWVNYTVVVQRTFNVHSGHNPEDQSEGHLRNISPELIEQIEHFLTLGVKPDTILVKAHEWSKERGFDDLNSRTYFVTPKDIENIRTCMMRKCRLHKDDAQSTTKLLEGPLREHVIFYQAYTDCTDLIIVLQTPSMKTNLDKYGLDIVFMDATYCVNQYDFPLYTLAIRDNYGHGIPVAFLVLGNEKQSTLELALEKLRPIFTVAPRCFMVDKDQREINALQKVFPESDILLCWYHVTQAIMRWLSRGESGIGGPDNAETRQDILKFFAKLKSSSTKQEFEETSKMFLSQYDKFEEVCLYFKKNWENIGNLWADFGRCYKHGDSDTNNLIERFFHRLKYQFLSGVRNRRLDNLIDVILGKTNTYFDIIQDLQAAGRILNPLEAAQESPSRSAKRMQENGWIFKVFLIQTDTFIYTVQSETSSEVVYKVCPAEHYCSCVIGCRGQKCKHLLLINLLQSDDEKKFPDIATQLKVHAAYLLKCHKYTLICPNNKQLSIESLCKKGVSKPCINMNTCTCCSFSHYKKCACLVVAHTLLGITFESEGVSQMQSYRVSPNFDVHRRNSLSVRELENVLEIVRRWKTIPEHISTQIHELGVDVHRENNQNASSFIQSCSNDNSRKICPLFPNRTKKRKASLCNEATNSKSFPVKKRKTQKLRQCKRTKKKCKIDGSQ